MRNLLQVELQAARQHRHRDLLRIGRREHELHVLRRLLERLQHRVEGVAREHVHFVDDVDLVAAGGRRVQRVLEQLAHVVDLRVGRRVELDQVDEAPGVDLGAGARTCRTARR